MNKEVKKIIEKNKYRAPFYHLYKNKSIDLKKKGLHSFLNKVLLSIIILLFLLICKNSDKLYVIYDKTFQNLNFMQIKLFLTDNFNVLFPNSDKDKNVDAVVIDLNNSTKYHEGMLIKTNYGEPILSCVEGIVIQIYHDEDLGKVYVIQDKDGLEYHYGYLDNSDLRIYSSVNYGQIIGVGRINANYDGEYYLAIKDGKKALNIIDVINKS
ncbi:MAG TPA: M23 family metallopeptidase [Haloplasmataceae bacterium]